jgi:hypothetical protein
MSTLKINLGDSLFARLNDNGDLVLTLEDGLSVGPTNTIVIKPDAFAMLMLIMGTSPNPLMAQEKVARMQYMLKYVVMK